MVLQPEDSRASLGLIAPDALKDCCAIVHALAEKMDCCLLPGQKISVKPNKFSLLQKKTPVTNSPKKTLKRA